MFRLALFNVLAHVCVTAELVSLEQPQQNRHRGGFDAHICLMNVGCVRSHVRACKHQAPSHESRAPQSQLRVEAEPSVIVAMLDEPHKHL